jgi:hypothetical protein
LDFPTCHSEAGNPSRFMIVLKHFDLKLYKAYYEHRVGDRILDTQLTDVL